MGEPAVWFDFENTPHVLFLEPFISRLAARGVPVWVTAKPQSQTLELAQTRGLPVTVLGGGDHTAPLAKIVGGLSRAVALGRAALVRGRPSLLVSSSRTASLAAWMTRIPAIGLLDYEHAEHRALARGSRSLWFPDMLRNVPLPRATRRVARFYPGLKENLYLDSWKADRRQERERIGVEPDTHLVLARPPAATAHYSSDRSMVYWRRLIAGLMEWGRVRAMILPRTRAQAAELKHSLPSNDGIQVLEHAVSGPSLVAAADLVVSGGGTMNREAAVLGVPAWSVFSGPPPAIDEQLAREGRLRWVRSESEVEAALASEPGPALPARGPYPEGITSIMQDIESNLS